MSKNPTKKVILLIVEGPSDKTALENGVRKAIAYFGFSDKAIFKVVHGDGTLKSPYGNYFASPEAAKRTQKMIVDFLKQEKSNGIRLKDIAGVAQITDLDATFAPCECFVTDEHARQVTYDLSQKIVYAPSGYDIAGKRDQKRLNLMRLSELSYITIEKRQIPYQIFYFGIDLEHALYNEINCDDAKKRALAENFDDQYGDDPEAFMGVFDSIGQLSEEYRPSWNDENLSEHSFERLTNLPILFDWIRKISNQFPTNPYKTTISP